LLLLPDFVGVLFQGCPDLVSERLTFTGYSSDQREPPRHKVGASAASFTGIGLKANEVKLERVA